jgi:uncharacterized protein YkwD
VSDPFADYEPFGSRCSVCGSLTCNGCGQKDSRTRRISSVAVITAVGGVVFGLLLGFLFFSGGDGVGTSAEKESETEISTTTTEQNSSVTSSVSARFLPTTADEILMLELVNQVRAQNGAGKLSWCPALIRSSLAHSKDMALRNYFDHVSPEGGTILDRTNTAGYNGGTVGENIAFGQRSVNEVMRGWIGSPGHFENLINSDYEHFGYATASGQYQSSRGLFWTQNFGALGKCD